MNFGMRMFVIFASFGFMDREFCRVCFTVICYFLSAGKYRNDFGESRTSVELVSSDWPCLLHSM